MKSAVEQKIKPEIIYLRGNALVPSKALAFKKNHSGQEEIVHPRTHQFENDLKADLQKELHGVKEFPTSSEVFVSIVLGFHSKGEYNLCDLDNKAKTILDALKGAAYKDDSQVKMLWIHKALLSNGEQESFYRISVKILDDASIKVIQSRMLDLIN